MICTECRESLDAMFDGELRPEEASAVRQHLATCADCTAEFDMLTATSRAMKEGLVRHKAPDVLQARIRNAIGMPDAFVAPERAVRPRWAPLIAAAVVLAVASSALTVDVMQHRATDPLEREVLASHIRSLMPGHLTDVVSSDQHTVKPWFDGRVDVSPSTPNLDSLGFPLVGGRLDYVDGRAVPVVVYARRQHIINVYSRPVATRASQAPHESTTQGYHEIVWRTGGIELWVVSDLSLTELDRFVALYRRFE